MIYRIVEREVFIVMKKTYSFECDLRHISMDDLLWLLGKVIFKLFYVTNYIGIYGHGEKMSNKSLFA